MLSDAATVITPELVLPSAETTHEMLSDAATANTHGFLSAETLTHKMPLLLLETSIHEMLSDAVTVNTHTFLGAETLTHETPLLLLETSIHKTLSDAATANIHELVHERLLFLAGTDAETSNSHKLTDAETSTHETLSDMAAISNSHETEMGGHHEMTWSHIFVIFCPARPCPRPMTTPE